MTHDCSNCGDGEDVDKNRKFIVFGQLKGLKYSLNSVGIILTETPQILDIMADLLIAYREGRSHLTAKTAMAAPVGS